MTEEELIFNISIYFLPSFILFLAVFRNRLRIMPKYLILPVIVLLLLSLVGTVFMFFHFNLFQNWLLLYSAVYVVLLAFLCKIVIKSHIWRILFVLLFLYCYSDNVNLFCTVIQEFLLHFHCAGDRLKVTVILHIVTILCTFPFLCFFMERKIRPMIEMESIMPYWRMLWTIPASFCAIYRVYIFPTKALTPLSETWAEQFWPFIWIIGTNLCFLIILLMLSETAQMVELKERLYTMDLRFALQKEQYKMIQNSIETARRSRHDIRHHMLVIKGYLDNKNYDGMYKYLNQYFKQQEEEVYCMVCENAAADVILQHWTKRARRIGVKVTLAVDLPAALPVPESDVCIVLSNLLENAVEACEKQQGSQQFIDVKAAVAGNQLIIMVRNSYQGDIQCDNGLFASSKHQGSGIGIESVRGVASRYHGNAKFTYYNHIFEASVLLSG